MYIPPRTHHIRVLFTHLFSYISASFLYILRRIYLFLYNDFTARKERQEKRRSGFEIIAVDENTTWEKLKKKTNKEMDLIYRDVISVKVLSSIVALMDTTFPFLWTTVWKEWKKRLTGLWCKTKQQLKVSLFGPNSKAEKRRDRYHLSHPKVLRWVPIT